MLTYSSSICILIDEANNLIEVSQSGLSTEYKIDMLKSNYKDLLGLQKELIVLDFNRKQQKSGINFI